MASYTDEIVSLTKQINDILDELDLYPRLSIMGNNGDFLYVGDGCLESFQPEFKYSYSTPNGITYEVDMGSLRFAIISRIFLGGKLNVDWKEYFKHRKGK